MIDCEAESTDDENECTCKEDCPSDCKGQCGCKKCHDAYQDFLSGE